MDYPTTTYGPTFAEVVGKYHERRRGMGLLHSKQLDVREQYNGDVVIPLPELDKFEQNAVANLLTKGLDQMSMRSTSTDPDPLFFATRPGFDKWEDAAVTKRKVVLSWWQMNRLSIRQGRQFRRFYGYGRSATMLVPDFKRGIPSWEFRDPLTTYPAPSNDPDDMTPSDCIFIYEQNGRWLKNRYPAQFAAIADKIQPEMQMDTMFEIIEYCDDEVCILGVLGSKRSYFNQTIDGSMAQELTRYDNLAGICPAVVPQRVTLDRNMGMFDGMLGMYHTQSMLQALGVIATKRSIFRDQWVVARQGEIPRIIQTADGVKGRLGMIAGGEIQTEPLDPPQLLGQMVDRIEDYQRQEGGIPEQMTGSGPTNSRTGRASDAILSATVDYTVQEAQKIIAWARQEEDVRAIAIAKAYWTGKKSFYVDFEGKQVSDDYDARELFDTDNHLVQYAHAGVDENGRMIEIGQMLGLELIPKADGRRLHPLIRDPEQAGKDVMKEGLQAAVLTSVQQMASQPGAPLADVARIAQLVVSTDVDIIDAVMQVQNEAQQRQATQTPDGQPDTVAPGSPEAQPGLSPPGAGMEQPTAPPGGVAPPTTNVQDLSNLFQKLRTPARELPQERNGN